MQKMKKAYSCANAVMQIKYCLKWNEISRTTFKSTLLKRNLHYKQHFLDYLGQKMWKVKENKEDTHYPRKNQNKKGSKKETINN